MLLVKQDAQIRLRAPFTGKRLHTILGLAVEVDWDIPWKRAIELGAPATPKGQAPGIREIWDLGDQYQPEKTGIETVKLSLCFAGPCGVCSWIVADAFEFTQNTELTVAGPREILALGQSHPNLHKKIGEEIGAGVEMMYLMSLKPYVKSLVPHMPELCLNQDKVPLLTGCAAHHRDNFYYPTWFVLVGDVPLAP